MCLNGYNSFTPYTAYTGVRIEEGMIAMNAAERLEFCVCNSYTPFTPCIYSIDWGNNRKGNDRNERNRETVEMGLCVCNGYDPFTPYIYCIHWGFSHEINHERKGSLVHSALVYSFG